MKPRAWPELVALALWLLATIGLRPLLLPDEGRYASVALEMLRGDGLVPTLNSLPFFHKPPLLYWLDMAAMSAFGVNDFAVRVGPALLGWVLGAALFLHLRRWHGLATARVGLAVLATSPLFFVGAQYVNHDIGVAACITAAVLAWVRAVDAPVPAAQRVNARRWMLAGWVFCALGVLAKGLIGIVLPVAVVLPWLLAQRRWRDALALAHPAGLAVFALVVLPWMWAMQQRFPGFFDYFIVEQHFKRYAETTFNNRAPIWFFFAVLPLLMLPWTLRLWPVLRLRGAQAGLYGWWVLVIVGFFSLPASKLVGYVMPALAPAAALLALVWLPRVRAWQRTAAVSALLCVAVVAVVAWKAPSSRKDIGQALAARLVPGDTVVFVDQYFYDVPFYAQLRQPVRVVSDWADPAIPLRDNWRKELADAARFSPDGGRSVLWPWAMLNPGLCASGRVWLVTTEDNLPRLQGPQGLPGLVTVLRGRHATLLQACAR